MGTIEDVKRFWTENPLFQGESSYTVGTREFFDEHRSICINDCLGGKIDDRVFPEIPHDSKILDLGCGPGFWLIEFNNKGFKDLHAADLTETALKIAQKRCDVYFINIQKSVQNAENMDFSDKTFDHVNCQGVIHHSPDTEKCVAEIARVLKPGGTASISVYYKNIVIRHWIFFNRLSKLLSFFGAKLQGRGREKIFKINSADEIVRLYDGADNPVGKAYTRDEFIMMLSKSFIIEKTFFHFFPARTMPIRIPKWVHAKLDHFLPFMIYANVRKP